ncbi:TauD/TfdA family dioxygenase [Micromonospora sp. NPDC048999]|uniref:TauD/TfdA family dioxygenase n=1 Tax=Micromonospora sp. NPDC048999 TaxID=3155391 RepID=UPI0034007CE4
MTQPGILDGAPTGARPGTPAGALIDAASDLAFGQVVGLRLDAQEHRDLAAIAQRLAAQPPGLVDDARWLAAARDLSAELPLRLRQCLRRFATDAGAEAMLLLRNLPVAADKLPDTPSHADSVQRGSTVPASVLTLIALSLGEPVAFREEKSGALVQDVVPVPGMETFPGNAGSVPLSAHVENAFHPHRPDIVGLCCLRSDHDNRAGLQVASIRRALAHLTEEARSVLGEARFRTAAPASFGPLGTTAPAHPVLAGDPADPDLIVDFESTAPVDEAAAAALRELAAALHAVRRTVVLAPGDLALVDNRLATHGRTAFAARYDGRDRWLQRVFIHRDFRRSRALRPGGGHVLTSRPGD